MQHPLCVRCEAQGRVEPAVELDHRIPLHKGGPDTEDNWQGLCVECHRIKSAADVGKRARPTIGPDGWPVGVVKNWRPASPEPASPGSQRVSSRSSTWVYVVPAPSQ